MENRSLMTDFYELTMAETYFEQNKQDENAYFDLFSINNPVRVGYRI